MPAFPDPLVMVIGRDDVESGSIDSTLSVLSRLIDSLTVIREYEERVEIAFAGYDDHPAELCEIEQVRAFVHKLDERFPYWLYFLTKEGTGLQALAWCFLPPYLTPEGQRQIWPQRLGQLLERRWVPALIDICVRLGLSQEEIDKRISSAGHYFLEGPRMPFDPNAA